MPILDHPILSKRYFFPRSIPPSEPLWVDSHGERLACYASRPHPGGPTLVHFHGNGEVVADYQPDFTEALTAAGFNVLYAEYRGYGTSSGAPTLIGMLDDVDAIFDAALCPPERTVVYGRSVGSIFALELAHRQPKICRLVIESGIANPLERILMRVSPAEMGHTHAEIETEAKKYLDHEAKLRAYKGQLLVLHARHDTLVALENAERMVAWAGGETLLQIFEQGDHNTILSFNAGEIMSSLRRISRGG